IVSHPLSLISRLCRGLALLAVLLLTAGMASDQSPTATLSGAVVDETAARASDAAIVLLGAATAPRRGGRTTSHRTFAIPLPPAGRYGGSAGREGSTPLQVPRVVLTENDKITLHLELKVAGIVEKVVVTAEKRAADSLDVPVPVSVLGAADANNLASTSQ